MTVRALPATLPSDADRPPAAMIPVIRPEAGLMLATIARAAELGESDPHLLRHYARALRADQLTNVPEGIELIAAGRHFSGAAVIECVADPERVAALRSRHRRIRIRVMIEPMSAITRERTVLALARAGADELCISCPCESGAVEGLSAAALGAAMVGGRALRIAAPAPEDVIAAYELCLAGSRWGSALPEFRLTGAETVLRAAIAEAA